MSALFTLIGSGFAGYSGMFSSLLASGGTPAASGTLTAFLTSATEMLTWIITSIGSILAFMFTNTACLIGLCVWLVICAIGIIRSMIG